MRNFKEILPIKKVAKYYEATKEFKKNDHNVEIKPTEKSRTKIISLLTFINLKHQYTGAFFSSITMS